MITVGYERIKGLRARGQRRDGTYELSKSMRLGWPEGGIIEVGFTAKSKSKSVVAVAHTKLPDKETVDRLKRYWSERFDVLGEVLAAT